MEMAWGCLSRDGDDLTLLLYEAWDIVRLTNSQPRSIGCSIVYFRGLGVELLRGIQCKWSFNYQAKSVHS